MIKTILTHHKTPVKNGYFSTKIKIQGWQGEYRTDYLKGLFSTSSFLFMKKVVQFYITEIEPNFNIDAVLTKTQQELYGLTECVEY